ncbi:hemolysin family protein [Elusimicrobiota bacterium]
MTIIIIKICIVVFLLILSAFFSASEISLTSLSILSIRNIKDRFQKMRKYLEFWENKPNEILSTILVGNNIAGIGMSVVAASISFDVIYRFNLPKEYVLVAVPFVVTLIILLFGEIGPKVLGRYNAGKFTVFGLPILYNLNVLFKPVNKFSIKLAEINLSIFGKKNAKEDPFLRSDEIQFLLSSENTIPLPDQARRIMKNVLEFGDTRISHVMVPKSEIRAVDLNQDTKKAIEQIIDTGYSRVPVFRENIDNIVGIIYSRDLALAWRDGSLFLIDDLIRPAYFVPESAHIDKVLREFKTAHHHMALVVDEFGSMVGLATIEDLVEELVGEIWDEYDIQEKKIINLPDGSYLFRAMESLSYINDELKLGLPEDDFSTVNGWIMDLFGRIPKTGESIRWDKILVEIVSADKKKILKVKIKKTL